jgi:hypothetical protein
MLLFRLIPAASLFLLPALGQAQLPNVNWAGPDTVSCGEKGVMLGVPDDCPNCCFSWSPAEGLDAVNIQRPTARPKKPTIYTVVVTDENFSTMKSDKVDVGLSFGELHFVPDHLTQGTMEIVLARLKNNTEDAPTTWSIEDPDLDCNIDTSLGDHDLATITPGSEYGKILVKVQKTADSTCYFVDTLPVNNGVKDLILIDDNTPNRVARTGETLYLIGNSSSETKARLIAVPNEGGFSSGIPDYKVMPDSPTPIDGEDEQIMDGNPGILNFDEDVFAAGDDGPLFEPRITVRRRVPIENTSSLPELATSLTTWFNNLFNFDLNLSQQDIGLSNPPGTPAHEDPACSAPVPFDVDVIADIVWKESDVEKFNSPNKGLKRECVIDLGLTVFGRVYHPYFTRRIPLLGVCSEMYAGFDLSIPLHLGLASDESLESDDWMANDPQLEAAINWVVGLGATLDDENSGYSLNVSGSASITAKAFLEYKSPARQLVAYAKLFPVVMKINASVDSESNMGDSEPLFQLISEEIVLFKEFSSPTITLHTFTE